MIAAAVAVNQYSISGSEVDAAHHTMVEDTQIVAGLDRQPDWQAACEDLAHMEVVVGTHSAELMHHSENLRRL